MAAPVLDDKPTSATAAFKLLLTVLAGAVTALVTTGDASVKLVMALGIVGLPAIFMIANAAIKRAAFSAGRPVDPLGGLGGLLGMMAPPAAPRVSVAPPAPPAPRALRPEDIAPPPPAPTDPPVLPPAVVV